MVGDRRAAGPDPAVSDYAPRDEPALEPSPAPQGTSGAYISNQVYTSGQDHRVMDRRNGHADNAGGPQDRPVRGSLAELRFRLEGLPAGHPSSPYDDQGARKPAPQQLRQLELPLADEERESDSPARASLLAATAGDPNGAASRHLADAGHDDDFSLSARLTVPAAPEAEPSSNGTAHDVTEPAPDWITSTNGTGQADPPGRPAPVPVANGSKPYESRTELSNPPSGDAIRSRDRLAGASALPSPSKSDPYDTDLPYDAGDQYAAGAGAVDTGLNGGEHPARNGRADQTDAFSSDWRNPGNGAGRRNGHSGGYGAPSELDAPAPPADLADLSGAADPGQVGQDDSGPPAADQPSAEPHSGLTPEQEQIANLALGRYRAASGRNVFGGYGESGLTPAIRRVEAHLPHGRLAPETDEYTLKSPARFKEKLARMIARNPGVPAEELAAEIYDAARYTFLFEPQDYTDGTWLVHRRLKAHGFELEARRNRWESPEFKGIRTRWRDPAHDLAFEVQFHTPASWDVMQRTHGAYLRITDAKTPAAERAQLRSRQVTASAATRPPPRSAEIGDFRTDVR
jgi:hypothetical protein